MSEIADVNAFGEPKQELLVGEPVDIQDLAEGTEDPPAQAVVIDPNKQPMPKLDGRDVKSDWFSDAEKSWVNEGKNYNDQLLRRNQLYKVVNDVVLPDIDINSIHSDYILR